MGISKGKSRSKKGGGQTLSEERQNVACDEQLGEPADPDWRVLFRLNGDDDSLELHVDGAREECGGNEQQQCLLDIWP